VRVRVVPERVEALRGGEAVSGILLPDLVVGVQGLDAKVLSPSGESFIEPEPIPPLHGHEVAEPLVSELVCDDNGDTLLGLRGCLVGDQQSRLSVSDKAPIFLR